MTEWQFSWISWGGGWWVQRVQGHLLRPSAARWHHLLGPCSNTWVAIGCRDITAWTMLKDIQSEHCNFHGQGELQCWVYGQVFLYKNMESRIPFSHQSLLPMVVQQVWCVCQNSEHLWSLSLDLQIFGRSFAFNAVWGWKYYAFMACFTTWSTKSNTLQFYWKGTQHILQSCIT